MRGYRIREVRLDQDMSLRTLARRSGLDPSHLSRMERGLAGCSVQQLMQIARALRVPLSELLDELR